MSSKIFNRCYSKENNTPTFYIIGFRPMLVPVLKLDFNIRELFTDKCDIYFISAYMFEDEKELLNWLKNE